MRSYTAEHEVKRDGDEGDLILSPLGKPAASAFQAPRQKPKMALSQSHQVAPCPCYRQLDPHEPDRARDQSGYPWHP